MSGGSVIDLGILLARKMFWYKLLGYVTNIVQHFCKTDLEGLIVNSIKQVCTVKMVAHMLSWYSPKLMYTAFHNVLHDYRYL
jgi:hypothetical protein